MNSSVDVTQPVDLPTALERASVLVVPALDAALALISPELRAPIAHHLASGGKRLRAALVLVAARAAGADEAVGVPGAVAIELIHNFSLLHDDIIDGDTDRRHRPTVWAEFGVGQAIIAGDALAALATQVLMNPLTDARVRAAALLADATQAMIAGQASDMAFEARGTVSVDECLAMAAGKTGALLACSTAMGATLAGAPPATVDALADFGHHLGVAFQAIDDILGIWGDPERTGKPVGNDLIQQKKSIPVAFALDRADARRGELTKLLAGALDRAGVLEATRIIEECGGRDETTAVADKELDLALAALDSVDLDPGPRAELVGIARFVTDRDR